MRAQIIADIFLVGMLGFLFIWGAITLPLVEPEQWTVLQKLAVAGTDIFVVVGMTTTLHFLVKWVHGK